MTQPRTKQINLRIPGPTPVPPDILEAVGRSMINHRGREFGDIVKRSAERLKDFFLTRQDVMILSASGTGGLESAIVNVLSPAAARPAVQVDRDRVEFGSPAPALCHRGIAPRAKYPGDGSLERATHDDGRAWRGSGGHGSALL